MHRDDFVKLMPYFPQVAQELRKSNERIIREIQRHKEQAAGPDAVRSSSAASPCACVCARACVCERGREREREREREGERE